MNLIDYPYHIICKACTQSLLHLIEVMQCKIIRNHTKHVYLPTKRIIEDPLVLTGTNPTQDTVIPFSAVLGRVDVNVVLSTAISVTV